MVVARQNVYLVLELNLGVFFQESMKSPPSLILFLRSRWELKDSMTAPVIAAENELGRHPLSRAATPARWLAASMLLVTSVGSAQESLRNSLTGDAAAAAQRRQIGSLDCTYKAGDFRLLLTPSLAIDYNDNITLTKTDAERDIILRPLMQLAGSYPVTQHNLLSLSVGVGWDDYLEHGQYSALRVDANSLVSFDMFIKDIRINLHERFSALKDPGAEAAVAGTAQYGMFDNVAGLTATWDLEDVVLTLGYDHANYIAMTEQFSYLNRSSELPVGRVGFQFNPRLTAGVEGSASFTRYNQEVLNDSQNYSAGLYANWQPSSYFHVTPRAGYDIYQFQHTSESIPAFFLLPYIPRASQTIETSDLNSWYADLTVSHQLSGAISYGLSAGHEIVPGIEADVLEDSYIKPGVTWSIFKNVSVNTSFFYEHGNQGEGNVSGNLVEAFDWYGGNLLLGYSLMKKLMLTLNYRLTLRSSDIPDRGYAQNIVGIKFSYQLQ